MKYIFVKNINQTGETGIIDLEEHKIVCLCTEKQSEILLKALESYSNKKDGEVALPFAEAESFIEFLNSNFEKYISRWEIIGKPEKGNWTMMEVYEKYKNWMSNRNDRQHI